MARELPLLQGRPQARVQVFRARDLDPQKERRNLHLHLDLVHVQHPAQKVRQSLDPKVQAEKEHQRCRCRLPGHLRLAPETSLPRLMEV